jgi:endo-1,4-beta-xylanase
MISKIAIRTSAVLFCVVVCIWAPRSHAENLLKNPGFEAGNTSGWTCWGGVLTTAAGSAHSGRYCALISGRTQTWQGPVQSVRGLLKAGTTYRLSAWVKLQNGTSEQAGITVCQADAAGTDYHGVVSGTATEDRWSCLSGYFTPSVQGTLSQMDVYIEGPSSGVSFYIDDVGVEEVGDWRDLVRDRTEQCRKRDAILTVLSSDGRPVGGVEVQVHQIRHRFAFGSVINTKVLQSDCNNSYADFFRDHFEWAVLENESKWYHNEPRQGYVTYDDADRIYDWCHSNGITMRGHCLYWAAENMVQSWLKALSTDQFRAAVESRMESAVAHFKGKFVHWDINNEMVPNHYFKDRLGEAIRVWMFQRAHEIDPNCVLFVNEYNVISGGYSLDKCMKLVEDLLDSGAPVQAIGVQCHFSSGFDRWAVLDRFDKLATLGLPIWCTEFDMADPNEYVRANEIEDFYRIAFSQPAVQGILMWGFWENSHWRKNCYIVNADWSLNEAGRRYESLMDEWTTQAQDVTDESGAMQFRGFLGTYEVEVSLPDGSIATATIDLSAGDEPADYTLQFDPSGGITAQAVE